MDYDAIDREMSSWIVTCVKNATRFYLTPENCATDIRGRANLYRWENQAANAVDAANSEYSWQGFHWYAMPLAEAMAEKPSDSCHTPQF
jgi:hypothetical protein